MEALNSAPVLKDTLFKKEILFGSWQRKITQQSKNRKNPFVKKMNTREFKIGR